MGANLSLVERATKTHSKLVEKNVVRSITNKIVVDFTDENGEIDEAFWTSYMLEISEAYPDWDYNSNPVNGQGLSQATGEPIVLFALSGKNGNVVAYASGSVLFANSKPVYPSDPERLIKDIQR